MKHNLKITIMLLVFFLSAQYIGLLILSKNIDLEKTEISGETTYKELPIGERPPLEEKNSYWTILGSIFVGTILLLLLIKLNWIWVWKIWFVMAVFISLSMALGSFIRIDIALLSSLILAVWKVFKPNFWIQNFTEVFVYGGLAVIFVPVLNLFGVSILLVLIAFYDAYAVWKSKHMITLAQSQTKAKVFAGLYIPYKQSVESVKEKVKSVNKRIVSAGDAIKSVSQKIKSGKEKNLVEKEAKVRTAVLGGGDIGFPLIFAGVVMKELGLWQSLVIPFFALGGLAFLLWYGNEKKFYPAMPFIGAGCFLGLLLVWLIGFSLEFVSV